MGSVETILHSLPFNHNEQSGQSAPLCSFCFQKVHFKEMAATN